MRAGGVRRSRRVARATVSLGVLAGLALSAAAGAGMHRGVPMPGPTVHERSEGRLTENEDCVTCHDEIAAEWAASLHARSYVDPMFQAALERETKPAFCRSCHVPEADPRSEPDPRRARLGVACVSCHLVDGEILAGPAPNSAGAGAGVVAAPHPVRREAEFSGPAACGGCHEFAFPRTNARVATALMQQTLREHARSPAHQTSCQECHMPPRSAGGRVHRGHGFAVASEPRMLRAAARIEAVREAGRVRVILEPRAAGHAFPTGDLFRRLLVRVEIPDAGWSHERILARHFGGQRLGETGAVKVELSDDRVGVGVGPRVVELDLPESLADQELHWSVRYQRVLDAPAGAEQRADVWDETELAAGVLPPGDPQEPTP